MRISDWSSDVCSSDLDQPVILRMLKDQPAAALRERCQVCKFDDCHGMPAADVRKPMPPGWWRHSRRNVRRTRRFRVGKVIIGRLFSPEDLVDQDAGQPVLSEAGVEAGRVVLGRSEEHTSELQSLMRSSYAVF